MTKKIVKKTRRRAAPKTCMIVVRVTVSLKDAPAMKVWKVTGAKGKRLYDLEILNAYYDHAKLGSPDAMPRS